MLQSLRYKQFIMVRMRGFIIANGPLARGRTAILMNSYLCAGGSRFARLDDTLVYKKPLRLYGVRISLFLGAGASAFAEYPTTKELLSMVEAKVRDLGIPPTHIALLENILKEPKLDDIEKLYSAIDDAIALQNEYCNPITQELVFSSVPIPYPEFIKSLKMLRSTIRETLLDVFKSESVPDDVSAVYNKLYSTLTDNSSSNFHIFTTNYDQVLEGYCDASNFELTNGFSPDSSSMKRLWDDKWNRENVLKTQVLLVKLHGSINWHRDTQGRVVEQSAPAIRDDNHDVMIFPTLGLKRYRGTPFLELMMQFGKMMERVDVLVVVGFSYRDLEITDAIRERCENGMIVLSVSPTPEDLGKAFGMKAEDYTIKDVTFEKFHSNIFAYESEFGPDTIQDVCKALDVLCKERQK